MPNKNLQQAKTAKKDEFYTQLEDIEKEIRYYKQHFKGKTVLCNCDDPKISNFFVYFVRNFAELGLKRLITTCYKNCQPTLFSENKDEHAVWLDYRGGDDNNLDIKAIQATAKPLKGDGDFRSLECIELLKEADIVVTNPPFSLFSEYVAQLIKYDKKFLILGNINQVTTKVIFPLMKNDKIWWGLSTNGSNRWFQAPDYYIPKKNAAGYKEVDGKKYLFVNGIMWYTNLEHNKHNQPLDLFRTYDPAQNQKYDNYYAIDVKKVTDIPIDYDGVMGVPFTFFKSYCKEQFEIIGLTGKEDYLKHLYVPGFKNYDRPYIDGKRKFPRLLIQKKQ